MVLQNTLSISRAEKAEYVFVKPNSELNAEPDHDHLDLLLWHLYNQHHKKNLVQDLKNHQHLRYQRNFHHYQNLKYGPIENTNNQVKKVEDPIEDISDQVKKVADPSEKYSDSDGWSQTRT